MIQTALTAAWLLLKKLLIQHLIGANVADDGSCTMYFDGIRYDCIHMIIWDSQASSPRPSWSLQ